MKKLILFLKTHHIIPVYRVDVLNYAYDHYNDCKSLGLCHALYTAKSHFNIGKVSLFDVFNIEFAKQYGADDKGYWWEPGVWNTGRLDFLKWMIDFYRNDKEDLRCYTY